MSEKFGIGEYPEVIKKIKNKDYLIKAHSTPCNKDKAISIIKVSEKMDSLVFQIMN